MARLEAGHFLMDGALLFQGPFYFKYATLADLFRMMDRLIATQSHLFKENCMLENNALPSANHANSLPASNSVQALSVQPLSNTDEKTWSLLAHLSVLLNLVTGFAGPIAAFIIYLVYKDRSRKVAFHALQSMLFQLIWWYGGGLLIGLMWAIVGALSAILIGIVLIPFAVLFTLVFAILPLGALVYGIIGAVQVSQGQDFSYWLVGAWIKGTMNG
jgi:uncharacterized Tic20 family protein